MILKISVMRVLVLLFVISSFPFVQKISKESEESASFYILRENPLTLYSENPARVTISVYNVSGEQVLYLEETLPELGAVVVDYDWNTLEQGIYYVNVSDGTDELLTKLIIRGS